MRHLVMPILLLLPACLSVHERALVGSWTEEKPGQTYTFERDGNRVALASITDSDGEGFVLLDSEVGDRGLSWTYQVPSTEYVVTCTAEGGVRDGRLVYAWTSSSPESETASGEAVLVRVSSP